MANSLFNQMMLQNPTNNVINMMKNSSNPNQLLMSLASQNPSIQNVINEVNANGGNAKDLFYKKAQQMGIDPNTILNQLR